MEVRFTFLESIDPWRRSQMASVDSIDPWRRSQIGFPRLHRSLAPKPNWLPSTPSILGAEAKLASLDSIDP
ncbi:MAG TPA: hypothetical protein VGF69_04510, partial [Thermoanaerobaculia bacterium]